MERYKAKVSPISKLVKEVIQDSGISHQYHESLLRLKWPQIAGKLVDKYTSSLKLKEETLFITVSNASLKSEILNNKSFWLNKIQSEFHHANIQDIKVK